MLPVAAVWRRKQKISLALIIIIPGLVTSARPLIGHWRLPWPLIGWAGITNNCLEMREQRSLCSPRGVSLLSQHFTFSQITQISNLLSSASRLCHKHNWLQILMLESWCVSYDLCQVRTKDCALKTKTSMHFYQNCWISINNKVRYTKLRQFYSCRRCCLL